MRAADRNREATEPVSVVCTRKLNGRYVVESAAGDRFEFVMMVKQRVPRLRLVGPPHWREGPWPRDAEAITAAARLAALRRARCDGFAV